MKKQAPILVLLLTLASCRLIDDKPNPCFACSLRGKDSCQLTDNLAAFAADRPGGYMVYRFFRCGAGTLNTVRFNYTGEPTGDSALINILVDSSATYTFPLSLPNGAKPLLQYQKQGFYELPLGSGVAFSQSCIVSFVLRTPHRDTIQNIFLHWAPKASGPAPEDRKSTGE